MIVLILYVVWRGGTIMSRRLVVRMLLFRSLGDGWVVIWMGRVG